MGTLLGGHPIVSLHLIWGNNEQNIFKRLSHIFQLELRNHHHLKLIYFAKTTPAIDRVVKLEGFGGFKQAANV